MSTKHQSSTLVMWLSEERPAAVKVASKPRLPEGGSRWIWWLPRSLIAYARKEPPAAPGELPRYTFTLPDWKIEEQNLWEFVKS